jgi:hypothetical protein
VLDRLEASDCPVVELTLGAARSRLPSARHEHVAGVGDLARLHPELVLSILDGTRDPVATRA